MSYESGEYCSSSFTFSSSSSTSLSSTSSRWLVGIHRQPIGNRQTATDTYVDIYTDGSGEARYNRWNDAAAATEGSQAKQTRTHTPHTGIALMYMPEW